MMITALLAIVVAIGWFDRGSSQHPPQQPATSATQTSTNANPQQNHPAKSMRQRLSVIWQRTWDDPVAFYTFILSIFTGLLAVVSTFQIIFLIKADKTARIAADAASLNAKAAIAIQSPVFQATISDLGYEVADSGSGDRKNRCWLGFISFTNLGASNAFPIEIRWGWTIGSKLPDRPAYTFAESLSVDTVINVSKSYEFNSFNLDSECPPTLYDDLRANKTKLWFYCSIAYLDFMQTRREAGFCWQRYEIVGKGFWVTDPTPAYNRKT